MSCRISVPREVRRQQIIAARRAKRMAARQAAEPEPEKPKYVRDDPTLTPEEKAKIEEHEKMLQEICDLIYSSINDDPFTMDTDNIVLE